jgi:hypothetical protein
MLMCSPGFQQDQARQSRTRDWAGDAAWGSFTPACQLTVSPKLRAEPPNEARSIDAPRSLANELFLGDSAQDDPQPPLSQSDLVLWHEREVPMRTDKVG